MSSFQKSTRRPAYGQPLAEQLADWQAPIASEPEPAPVIECRDLRLYDKAGSAWRAFITVRIGPIELVDCVVIEGTDGQLWLSPPSVPHVRRNGQREFIKQAQPFGKNGWRLWNETITPMAVALYLERTGGER